MEERHHQATQRQRQRFRDQGDVVHSRDLSMAIVLIAAALSCLVFAESQRVTLLTFTQHALGHLRAPVDSALWVTTAMALLKIVGPVLGVIVVAGTLAGVMQLSGNIPFKLPEFNVARLDPLPRLREMFADPQALIGVASTLVKVLVVSWIAVSTMVQRLPALLTRSPNLHDALNLLEVMAVRLGCVLILLGIADFGLAWFRLERKMRMSTQELKEDVREEMGDPWVRSKRRSKYQEMARQRSLKLVPKADVVLVNPTHFAVAILYQRQRMQAPKVVAKGADELAEKIRSVARSHNIPVVSNPPLTRLLYRTVRVGREVPADLYQAVASVLAYVYRLKRRAA